MSVYEGSVLQRLAAILSEVEKDQVGRVDENGLLNQNIPIVAGLNSLQDYIEQTCGIRHDLEFSPDWEKTLEDWFVDRIEWARLLTRGEQRK